mgnify:CR=1 FL=1
MCENADARIRLLGGVALVDLGIAAIAAIVSWVIGWRTLWQYCDAVQLGGMITISLGLWVFWHEWNLNRHLTYRHAQSASDTDGLKRTRLLRRDDEAGYRFFVHLFVAGLIAIVGAAVVQMALASR